MYATLCRTKTAVKTVITISMMMKRLVGVRTRAAWLFRTKREEKKWGGKEEEKIKMERERLCVFSQMPQLTHEDKHKIKLRCLEEREVPLFFLAC